MSTRKTKKTAPEKPQTQNRKPKTEAPSPPNPLERVVISYTILKRAARMAALNACAEDAASIIAAEQVMDRFMERKLGTRGEKGEVRGEK